MSENDYIAEYIKEKHPTLLGIEFGLWKFAKQITEAAKTIGQIFSGLSAEDIGKAIEEQSESKGEQV